MHTSRRHLLTFAFALALGACTVTTTGGVTTVTLDTGKIQTDGQALLTAGAQILASPGVAPQLGANLLTAQNALQSANTAFASVTAQLAPSVSVSLNTTSVQNAIKSVLADIGTVLQLVTPIVSFIPGGAAVSGIIMAVQELIPFVEVAAALVSAKPGATASGDEAGALRTIYGR